ncbi:threonine dehydrogenase-like Zn-dependent dehydrogenase [Rhizobium pisi]|uniref:Threonine dehydrogenase-like Zn-dependent dehydrogenase n=1 Tax=Rhizobium pisi TaxID=574561 RepID=A0A7W5BT19_9HYPH|nr:hypothetical protein [Rhizobium pisi]MBB3138610.1 threonine dehydrogenase-like Zn-dependent dehydrogenase [Rhizobium pisi]
MKAVRIHRFGGPEDMAIEEIDRPIPAANEVLIKVFAASINPVDVKMREGKYPIVTEKDLPCRAQGKAYPRQSGSEGCRLILESAAAHRAKVRTARRLHRFLGAAFISANGGFPGNSQVEKPFLRGRPFRR